MQGRKAGIVDSNPSPFSGVSTLPNVLLVLSHVPRTETANQLRDALTRS